MLGVSIRVQTCLGLLSAWLLCSAFLLVGCLPLPRRAPEEPQPLSMAAPSPAAGPAFPVVPSAVVIDLGDLKPGAIVERAFTLRNGSSEQILIDTVETSCECTTVKLSNKMLAPGTTTDATVRFDLSSDPDFTGGLLIDVAGWAFKGRDKVQVFALQVNADVRRTKR